MSEFLRSETPLLSRRFIASGRRCAVAPRRSSPGESPGSLLGEKRICCSYCGGEFPASKLRQVPKNVDPSAPRRFACLECLGPEEGSNE